jgi:hypothetical protein
MGIAQQDYEKAIEILENSEDNEGTLVVHIGQETHNDPSAKIKQINRT